MQWRGISELNLLDVAIQQLRRDAQAEIGFAVDVVTRAFFANTPVWSGETVRNYAWSSGGGHGGTRKPSGSLPSKGDFSEKNRGANEGAAMADARAAVPARLVDMHFTNLVDASKWNLIDAGLAPAPGKSRYPGGVETLSTQSARNALKNWK